ncbi:oligosaccharide flippase family protein [Photobacterium leiognathi]|uniref:oligosaccharide flippase family protein n=1 Tax=Photobacterium leiognathi TaxID=553611 RepID=UPI00020884DB|nr:oligosaccharide flippase family protein [Photobacterium leiognathi]PSW53762.1 hypothetical protein CTM83_08175 [Photobacterium leiognathi subsp. mandapamensis]GAA04681.1 mviN-like family protein [Photobacterium leiognathi subsp. mandapamensis svers.1.1.]
MNNALYAALKKSLVGRLSTYIIQFLSLAIYARIFTPEQFGVLASIQVFVIFFQMIAEIGIGPAIINEEKFGSKQRDGVFTVTLILGIILAICFYFFSYALNSFYGDYKYQSIAIIISFSILFNALNIVPTTALNKDAEFITIAKINILSEVISVIFVYLFYVFNFGLLALIFKSFFQSLSNLLLYWIASKETKLGRPFFGKEIFHIKKIAKFASYQFGFNVINYFSRNLDNILVGKYLGMSMLGIYDKTYQLMRYPLMITTFAIAPAIQPILTKQRNDVDKIVVEHNRLTMRLLFISILISAFIYINSVNIVLLLFGHQWQMVIPLLKLFSLTIPIQAVLSTSGSFYQVMNKPKLLFISGVLSAFMNVAAIVIGVYSGRLDYIAIALLISFSANFIQCYIIMFKFCFIKSPKCFIIGLVKVISISALPVSLYIALNQLLLNHITQQIILNLIANILLALFSLSIFYKFIKNILK